jgi:hypothetical protein
MNGAINNRNRGWYGAVIPYDLLDFKRNRFIGRTRQTVTDDG